MSLPRFSVNNSVLVNMMMLVLLFAGTVMAFTLVREMFPETRADQIVISVVYPAIQPDELEKAVTIKIEEAIRGLEEIEKVESTVREGLSLTVATLYNEVKNIDTVREKVDIEISSINSEFPDDIESITIRNMEPMLPVLSVSLYGQGNESARKKAARDLRDELMKLPGVSNITLSGIRDDEISVEIRPEVLLEYDLTFQEVAQAIRATNLDVSAGTLKGSRSQVNVRTLGEEIHGKDLGDIEIKTTSSGKKILLRDIALIRDEFVDVDLENYFNGEPSATLIIQKTKSQDAIQIANLVRAYVSGKQQAEFDAYGLKAAWQQPWYLRPFSVSLSHLSRIIDRTTGRPDPQAIYDQSYRAPFRHNFNVSVHSDLSRFVSGRLDLMTRNGISGLILLLISLVLFLNWKVAFWVALGLPVTFMGTFLVMWMLGVSINLLSMFGLIIVLGIVVDDAIIIGENIYRHVENGSPPEEAAVTGTEEVMWPVIVAISTTIAGFIPLMFIKGTIGEFMRELPIVVMAALSVSLVEALLVLPAHLKHLKVSKTKESPDSPSETQPVQTWAEFVQRKNRFVNESVFEAYDKLLRLAITWRYVTIVLLMSTVVVSVSAVMGGVVPFVFLQEMDSETITADIELPIGTVMDTTRNTMVEISEFVNSFPEVATVQTTVGSQMSIGGSGSIGVTEQPHLGQMIVELLEADERERRGLRSSQELLVEFRKMSESLPGSNSSKWEAMNGAPGGKDIEVRITGNHFEELLQATEKIKAELGTYNGVVDLTDNYDVGQREVQLRLLPSARPTGITVGELGSYVRFALYGIEARRITRNREDVKIMVRLPEEYRAEIYHLEGLRIPRPSGMASLNPGSGAGVNSGGIGSSSRWIPISEVAEMTESRSYATIHRFQQQRSISITGDVEEESNNAGEVVRQFQATFIPELLAEYPELNIEFQGATEDEAKSFSSLAVALPAALLMIYMMLAGLFRSYLQPVVVMSAIPFGLLGAIAGHYLTGNPITILSCIGFLALAAILINDSLVMVNFVNTLLRDGVDVFEANVLGAKMRLRAIFLTTLTTVAGLLPLMFETSFQAKFLIPMAVTLSYGLMFSTVMTLILVPCLNMVFDDFGRIYRAGWYQLTGMKLENPHAPATTQAEISASV